MKKDWFRRCDFLNIPTSLSYKSDYFYATKVGAVLTILIFFIIINIITYEIILLYKKSSFTLISNKYTDLSQVIDFSQNPFLFQLRNDKGKVIEIDNRLFRMEAYNMESFTIKYENGTKKKKLTNTKLEFEKCDKIYSNQSEYSELNLSNYFCINPDQNLTSYGLLGDSINGFKGIRIYINKCSGSGCYNDTVFEKNFHNAKFLVSYLSLSSNIFYLNNENLKYQLFTKTCSLSSNILKKIIFTYDIGRFELNNNIGFGNKKSFNYILGNDYSVDVDLDATSTIKKSHYTVAYISFHYGGNVVETRKQVQTIFESLSIVGNIFNIVLTLFKIINNYYSNKILFVDIFRTIFFPKENNNIKDNINLKNYLYLNNNLNKKNNLDLSNEICLNNNSKINKIKSIKSISKKMILSTDKNYIPRKSKTFNVNQGVFSKNKLMYYYLFPLWVLRKNRTLNMLYLIKDRICGYFSIEKINELIKFKETLEDKTLRPKINNTELIKISNNNLEKIE